MKTRVSIRSAHNTSLVFRFLFLFITFVFVQLSCFAQVINGYAKVTGLSGTTVNFSTNNQSQDAFAVGKKVMLIQMQDNVVGANTGNNSSFGTISTIGSAGSYEFLTIASISGSSITFTSAPTNAYSFNANSSVQIVTVKQYPADFTTTSAIAALPWNGDIGGVVAMEVGGTLTLANSVNADAKGFRGGARSINAYSSPFFTETCSSAPYLSSDTKYGSKGEGIYKNVTSTLTSARGKLANAGGGGNNTNAGGGGGSNFASGGDGGIGWQCPATSPASGSGGQSLGAYYSSNRIFMGGGGGGGQMNDSKGSNGGNGGGIVYLKAAQIATPSSCTGSISVSANGQSVVGLGNDGAGGGGAAGTVIIDAASYNLASPCPLIVSSNGGTGGSVLATNVHGAGGGGGQGAVIYLNETPTTNVTTNTLNGVGGCNNNTVPCTTFASTPTEPSNTGIISFTPLGVSFVEFTAESFDRNVLLKWSTASEEKSDYFAVERSSDGEIFTIVGQVKAAGSSQSLLEYDFIDANAFNVHPYFYYRLKEVDIDGKIMYSDVRFVQMNQQNSNHIVVFPNPFSEVLNVFIPQNNISENTQIFLTDELNRVISTYPVDNETTTLVLNDLSKGVYLISVYTDGKFLQTERVIK